MAHWFRPVLNLVEEAYVIVHEADVRLTPWTSQDGRLK